MAPPLPRRSSLRTRTLALVAVAALALGAAACSSDDTEDASSATAPETTADETTTTAEETTTTTEPEPVELPADRPIEVKLPTGYDEDEPAPLLVVLHGFGASGSVQSAYLGLVAEADERGMILVAPDGTRNAAERRFWNATDACCDFEGTEVDDLGYLTDVIAAVKADHAVDEQRVYLVGHSNGGFMSFRMACERSETIAAIVAIAASTMAEDDSRPCTPSEPVATLQVHGTADDTISYDGADNRGRDYPGALDTLATWAAFNGCDPAADDPAPEPRAIIADLEPATVTVHSDCDEGGHSELWTQAEGVHIPAFTPEFSSQVVDFLLAHPKP